MSLTKNATPSAVKKQLASKKWLIYTTLGLSMLASVSAFLSLVIGGMFGTYAYLLIAFILIDLVLIVASIKTNFRFSYSKTLPIIFIIIKAIMTLLIAFAFNDNLFSTFSLVVFLLSQLFSGISLAVCLIDASNRGKGLSFFALVLTGLLAISSLVFSANSFSKGLFGQGKVDYRAVTYTYLENTDSYRASGLVEGRGEKILIPETFNGKKVTEIDTLILEGVKEVALNTTSACFVNSTTKLDKDLFIFVDKENVDAFKQSLISKSFVTNKEKTSALMLANAITPKNLGEDEVFITFDYSLESFDFANGKIFPTWYGKKGDTFDISKHAKDIEYAKDYDLANEDYLYSRFIDNGYTLGTLTANDNAVNKTKIENSLTKLNVNFEKVLRITIGNDNDTVYETSEDFKSYNGTGFRFVVKADEYNLLSEIPNRDGFSLSWQYGVNMQSLTTLKEVLTDKDLTVYPKWSLNAPKLSAIQTDKANDTLTYGETVLLSAVATTPTSTVNLSYLWTFNGETLPGTNTCSITNAKPSQSGTYTLMVTAENSLTTSLTSVASKEVNITVNNNALGFDWILPTNKVYSGANKTISCTHVSSDVINGDAITYTVKNGTAKNVGNYTASVELTGNSKDLYYIKGESVASPKLTITPYNLSVTWGQTDFVYNGQTQAPTLTTCVGVGEDGDIAFAISGEQKNAGSYTATAKSGNANYTIENNTQTFTIAKKDLSVSWSNYNGLVYNGLSQKPLASLSGVVNGESVGAIVVGGQTNAGENYTATALVNNGNYQIISGSTKTFSIAKRPVTITYENTSLVYNGKNQMPTYSFYGIISSDGVELSFASVGINAGEHTLTASLSGNNDKLNNYEIVSGKEKTYNISKKPLAVVWGDITFTYNGEAQKPTATFNGLVNGETLSPIVSGEKISAGKNYVATASTDNGNYEITENTTTLFHVNKKFITISWGVTNFSYTGLPQKPTATFNGIIDGESVTPIVTGEQVNVGENYTAIADTDNENYEIISNKTTNFNIFAKKISLSFITTSTEETGEPISIQWIELSDGVSISVAGVTYTYYQNGEPLSQAPTLAGEYQVKVSLTNANYTLIGETVSTVTITQKSV